MLRILMPDALPAKWRTQKNKPGSHRSATQAGFYLSV
jgi:hypothetical protein